ncbi:MAG: DUF2236 domain-containing protein [Solirubrobacteraceae bacterium]|nr:DUF2236 domain-containing protein [Solirubrobacteraceae bacterium]
MSGRGEPDVLAGAAPLGPGSVTWRCFGDARGLLLAYRAGILQAMHPVISRALTDESDFFANPFNRLSRSGPPILRAVYGPDHDDEALWIRDRHRSIHGRMRDGRRYHALDPDAFFWAHATFFEGQIATQRLFGTPLTLEERRRAYAESITWYARYGLSMRPVPPDYDAFLRYWDRMFEETLAATPAATYGVGRIPYLPPPSDDVPAAAWAALRPALVRGVPWIGRGTLPRRARRILGVSWTPADEAAMRAVRLAVRTAWSVLPADARLVPIARDAFRRERRAVA